MTKEEIRLAESGTRKKHWKRWGPYLSERAWGTVREDYSLHGNAWEYLPHDHARSRAYRWNEDGLAGISDRRQMICFAVALWNERDPILKEPRLMLKSHPQASWSYSLTTSLPRSNTHLGDPELAAVLVSAGNGFVGGP
jgi:hypothetical protein